MPSEIITYIECCIKIFINFFSASNHLYTLKQSRLSQLALFLCELV